MNKLVRIDMALTRCLVVDDGGVRGLLVEDGSIVMAQIVVASYNNNGSVLSLSLYIYICVCVCVYIYI